MSAIHRLRRKWRTPLRRAKKRLERKLPALDLSVIPQGAYCYAEQVCPYWSADPKRPDQERGYCSLLELGDWQTAMGLLWDQVKECGIKSDWPEETE